MPINDPNPYNNYRWYPYPWSPPWSPPVGRLEYTTSTNTSGISEQNLVDLRNDIKDLFEITEFLHEQILDLGDAINKIEDKRKRKKK